MKSWVRSRFVPWLRVGFLAALGMVVFVPEAVAQSSRLNPVQRENAKTEGVTSAWRIDGSSHAWLGEIAGYASATSVNRGDTVDLHVHVADPVADATHSIELYRMGYYGGVGARLVMPRVTSASVAQPPCGIAPDEVATRMVECNWTRTHTLQIPTSSTDPTVAMSGVYMIKLTTPRGMASYIPLVVRDDARNASFMFQASFTTYQAYNDYGGYGFYQGQPDANGVRLPSFKVSFNRPFNVRHNWGGGQFFLWEFNAVRFLEREGYDVVYSTNLDQHVNGARLLRYRAFLSVGHDEYWTREMHDAIENARNGKVNLAFLGANTGYWQVRLESDAQGRPLRRMVGYRYWVDQDPQRNTPYATTLWRNIPGKEEAALVGVQYDHDPVDGDIHIVRCPRWMCRGTGVGVGTILPGLLGYEVDQVGPQTPSNVIVLGRSPYDVGGQRRYANMTYYTHGSGAGVFASGSMQWNWGLDDFQLPWVTTPPRTHAGVQAMTRNILNRFLTQPAR